MGTAFAIHYAGGIVRFRVPVDTPAPFCLKYLHRMAMLLARARRESHRAISSAHLFTGQVFLESWNATALRLSESFDALRELRSTIRHSDYKSWTWISIDCKILTIVMKSQLLPSWELLPFRILSRLCLLLLFSNVWKTIEKAGRKRIGFHYSQGVQSSVSHKFERWNQIQSENMWGDYLKLWEVGKGCLKHYDII